jgi:hypothetical protein
LQRLPARSQRFHVYLKALGACDQTPGDAASFRAATGIPLIDGGFSLCGRVADDPARSPKPAAASTTMPTSASPKVAIRSASLPIPP